MWETLRLGGQEMCEKMAHRIMFPVTSDTAPPGHVAIYGAMLRMLCPASGLAFSWMP